MENRKEYLAISIWVMFCMNYPYYADVIKYICEKCDKVWLIDHLKEKFDAIYGIYGAVGVMNDFFCELDLDLREALVDYAINVYAPEGMDAAYKEYKSL